jgi:hypothetical protein
MRAQFLRQIVHTFNNVLSNKKWDGIIVCNGIIVCVVPIREGEGGEEGTSIIAHANRQQHYKIKKPRMSAAMPKWECLQD